ncbi:MAG: hypothetical protein ABIW96_13800 [Polaromonas sp.]
MRVELLNTAADAILDEAQAAISNQYFGFICDTTKRPSFPTIGSNGRRLGDAEKNMISPLKAESNTGAGTSWRR